MKPATKKCEKLPKQANILLIVTTQDCDDITCHQTKVKFRGLTLLGNY